MDSHDIEDSAMHVLLHAWIGEYLRPRPTPSIGHEPFGDRLQTQAERLRESAVQLQLALEKMRIANERLAARMAEHKAFFARYRTPE